MTAIKAMKTCLKKKRYDSWRHAEDAAVKIYVGAKKHMNIYKCDLCGKHHLTSGVKR